MTIAYPAEADLEEEPAIQQAPEVDLDPRPDPSHAQAFQDWLARQVAAFAAADPHVLTPEKAIALRNAQGARTLLRWDTPSQRHPTSSS